MLSLTLAAAGLWLIILLLPWRPWSTAESFTATRGSSPLPDVTVLIPARNEAEHIAGTLQAVAAQGEQLRILLIDDQSDDGTGDVARALALPGLEVVAGSAPPAGWSGKLWALEQGRSGARTDLILLVDADIVLGPGVVAGLREKLIGERLGLVSLMVELRMLTMWERLLIPAFVYFFRLLYPFRLANSRLPWVAAAAGGCMLLRRESLEAIGGFAALHDAIIDDCTLARRFKSAGYRTWVGLTRSARSTRGYGRLADLWNMVARSAYTQLRYSTLLLAACTGAMLLAFGVPLAGLFANAGSGARLAAATAIALMAVTYVPTLRYYGLSPGWAATLPVTGLLYLAMTWSSALRYWGGERSRWKGRSYARPGTEPAGPGNTPRR